MIKLESLGDHSTRSTSTGDYSTGFSKKSHAQFSHHIHINSLQMMDYMIHLYQEHPSQLGVNISVNKNKWKIILVEKLKSLCAAFTKMAITPSSEIQKMHRLLHWKIDSYIFPTMQNMNAETININTSKPQNIVVILLASMALSSSPC